MSREASEPKKQTDIQIGFKQLASAIELAKSRFNILYDRLAPVRKPFPSTEGGKDKADEMVGSPIAQDLFRARSDIEILIRWIDQTIKELQV